MRILVARPREDAERLAAKLTARGHEPLVEPFLNVLPGEAPLPPLDGVQALLFTSANGARAFAAASARRDIKAFAVGDQTARVAREAGLTVESAGGAVEDLARLVTAKLKPEDGALLHVAGSVAAGDLQGTLTQAGFHVTRVGLYRVEPVEKLSDAVVEALKARKIDAVLLFSPRSAQLFHLLVSAAGVAEGCRAATLIGLSRAVIEAGASLPWAHRIAAAKPDEDAILAVIDNLPANRARATVPVAAPPVVAEIAREGETMATSRSVWPWFVGGFGLGALAVTGWIWTRDSDFALGTRVSNLEQRLAGERPDPGPRLTALEERVRALPPPAPDPAARLEVIEGRLNAVPANLVQRVTELERAITNLTTPRIQRIEDQQARQPDLTPRIEALERRPAPPPVDLATVNARLTALEQRAQIARPAPRDGDKPDESVVELGRRLVALEERVAVMGRTAPTQSATPIDLSPLRAEIAALGRRIDGLPRPTPVDLAPLRGEIAAVAQRVEALPRPVDLAPLRAEIATLATRIAALPPPQPVDLAPLNAEIAALGERLGQVERGQALAALRAAVTRGDAFEDELTAAQHLFPAAGQVLGLLAPVAARGVPTRAALIAAFDPMARAALAAERGDDPRWWMRWLDRARDFVRLRPAGDVPGDDTPAILARAEVRLRAGDLPRTIELLERLRGPAAAASQSWRAQAGAIVVTEAALASLAAQVGTAR